jgi:hypothetical protein
MRHPRVRKSLALLAVALVASDSTSAQDSVIGQFFGTWVGEDGPRQGWVFSISGDRVDIGPGTCRNLPYKILEIYPAFSGKLSIAIQVDVQGSECRWSADRLAIYRLWRAPNSDFLGLSLCPSLEDLELQAEGRNRYCDGPSSLVRKVTSPK